LLTYGGPAAPPENPSPESAKIPESLVILDFIADLFPSSTLLPKDPVERAKVRLFIDAVSNKFYPAFAAVVFSSAGDKAPEAFENLFAGIKALQELLPAGGSFAVGNEFTLADISILPFVARGEVLLSNDFGPYPEGEGRKAWEKLETDPSFARFMKYYKGLEERASFKKTFDAVSFYILR
jgi:glutathione S-transferase